MSEGNGRGNIDTQQAAERYMRAGLKVIPVPAGEKNPGRHAWQNERHSAEDVPRLWNNGQGIGALWGKPSGGLLDLDTDWREASIAARHILPATRTFGRPGAPESHRVYRVAGTVPKTKRYKVGGGGDDRSVVELLSTGTQSLVPPSLHDSGERRTWHSDQPAAEIDGEVLVEGVADVATAALIARNWPGQGARHDYTLAATGYVGRRLPRERAERVMRAAVVASHDEESYSRTRDVDDTLDSIESGHPVTGGATLENLAPGVVDQLRRWHGWGGVGQGPQPPTAGEASGGSYHLTDMGNAERLVARHGADLRYSYPWRKWLVWDGRRWAVDDGGEVARLAKETIRSIYAEAAAEPDDTRRKALADHAKRCEARSRIEALIVLAQSEPGIEVSTDELDADPWLLNAANGTVDLRSGELRPHDRRDLITKTAGTGYEPGATAPRFARFLDEVLVDPDVIDFVQRFAGYSLTGSTRERAFAILYGTGKNGKSTLVELLRDVLGDYATNTDAETVLRKKYSGVGNDVAALKGARFVSASEVEQGRALAESKVKQLTGRDTVTARFLFAEPFDFRPEFKLWLSTNNKPVIYGTDDAIWDRIRMIPFTQRFDGAKGDAGLPEKLREELPGVLAWMVVGCVEWLRDGLCEPDAVTKATGDYRAEMDSLAAFIDDECVVHPEAWCKLADLYAAYTRWCEDSNEAAEKKRQFGVRLAERGFEPDNGAKNVAIRRGIALQHGPGPGGASDGPGVNQGGPKTHEKPSGAPGFGEKAADFVNRVNEHGEVVNPQNPCKSGDSEAGVNEGYPQSKSLVQNPSCSEGFGNRLTDVNSLTPRAENEHLTEDEVQSVRELVRQGMREDIAREEVFGKGWVPE